MKGSTMMATHNHSPTPSLTMVRSLPQGVDELSHMGPFELFQSQLEHGSTEAKVDAMKRLSVVAYAMGADATLKELVPYLTNVAMKQPPQEDEILLILSSQIPLLVPALLSNGEAISLIPILERLATMEETVVRDEAVKATNHIVPYCCASPSSAPTAKSALVSMAKRLVAADWFTAKVSAAGMIPQIYDTTRDDELRLVYRDLAHDETPMVRRAAATHIGPLAKHLTEVQCRELLHPIWEQLCQDEQDSVRLLAVASLQHLKDNASISPEWTTQALLPLVKNGSTDLSWRVRHNLSKCFSDVAFALHLNDNFPSQKALTMACFVALLQDQEGEVRAGAVGHLAPMVHWGGPALFATHLEPLLAALADDVVVDVRSKCALALMDSSEGGTLADATIVKAFTPLLENFLQDEYPEVQLHVLNNLSRISHLLNQMSAVVSTILNMSKATNWRVREGVAQLLPHLADARGMEFFTSVLLEPAWMALLLDAVASVRAACVGGVAQLCRVAGEEWILSFLLPHHLKIYNHSASAYLMRMTILRAHAQMAIAAQSGNLFYQVVDLLVTALTTDKVANVRMVAVKGLYLVCTTDGCDESVIQSKIKPALELAIQKEEDVDCQELNEKCLAVC